MPRWLSRGPTWTEPRGSTEMRRSSGSWQPEEKKWNYTGASDSICQNNLIFFGIKEYKSKMVVLPAEEGKSLFCVLGTLRSLCWSSLACIRRERRISLGCGRWCYPSVCSQSLTSLTEPRALSLTEPWKIKNDYICVGGKLASGKIWMLY